MAISILSTPVINGLVYTGTFGSAGEYHVVFERQNLTSVTRSVATAITLGGAAMTLLASMEWQGDYVVAIWGMHVTPVLAGTAFTMVRTAGTYALTDRFDVAVLGGVSTSPLVSIVANARMLSRPPRRLLCRGRCAAERRAWQFRRKT